MKRTISASVLRSLVTPSILVSSLLVAFLYLSILFYTPNFRLLLTLLTNDYPLLSKLTIVGNLFLGGFLTQSPFGLVLLLLTAILIGLNIVLLTRSFHSFRKNSKAHIAVGGSRLCGNELCGGVWLFPATFNRNDIGSKLFHFRRYGFSSCYNNTSNRIFALYALKHASSTWEKTLVTVFKYRNSYPYNQYSKA